MSEQEQPMCEHCGGYGFTRDADGMEDNCACRTPRATPPTLEPDETIVLVIKHLRDHLLGRSVEPWPNAKKLDAAAHLTALIERLADLADAEPAPLPPALTTFEQAVERCCSFNCDADSTCGCCAHVMFRQLRASGSEGVKPRKIYTKDVRTPDGGT